MAHIALADHSAFGIVLRYAVRAVPSALLAADELLGAVQNHASPTRRQFNSAGFPFCSLQATTQHLQPMHFVISKWNRYCSPSSHGRDGINSRGEVSIRTKPSKAGEAAPAYKDRVAV
jgi:hypothetical protein